MAALFLFPLLLATAAYATPPQRPNVLFIAIDDLNHWVGYLGRNAQTRTPNILKEWPWPSPMGIMP